MGCVSREVDECSLWRREGLSSYRGVLPVCERVTVILDFSQFLSTRNARRCRYAPNAPTLESNLADTGHIHRTCEKIRRNAIGAGKTASEITKDEATSNGHGTNNEGVNTHPSPRQRWHPAFPLSTLPPGSPAYQSQLSPEVYDVYTV